MARTRRVDTNGPGIVRRRRGGGWSYHEEDGELISDQETIERIKSLAIPPAWKDVWICPHPRGHVQATGYDDAGRKQYVYHQDWREHRDREKFDEMLRFARQLPKLRAQVDKDLNLRGLVFPRVRACAVRLLDLGLFRIGNEVYENENRSYGLTTLKAKHLAFEDGEALFDYPSKSDQRAVHRISSADVIPVLRALKKRAKPGEDLLTYRLGRSDWQSLDSDQVNDFIKEIGGEEFSAKDFRTWNGTVLAAVMLAAEGRVPGSKSARKRACNLAIRETAAFLNNTPAVCRASYIDPRVFDRYDAGETIASAMGQIEAGAEPGSFPEREKIESAVVRLIEG